MFGNRKIRLFGVVMALLCFLVVIVLITQDFLEKRRSERLAGLRTTCSEYAAQQDWTGLETAANDWIELDSAAADAWLNLAEAHQKLGRMSECVNALLKVPRRDPKARQALLLASEMQLGEAHQPSHGIDTLRELRDLAPHVGLVRKQLISLYAMTLQREKMIEEIRDAFQYHAEPPEAYVYLMIADHLSFTNGFQLNTQWLTAEPDSELFAVARSIQLVDTLKKLEKSSPETEQQRISAEAELGDLFKKFPGNPALRNYLIDAAIADENPDHVEQLLSGWPDSAPKDSLLWRYRGWHAMLTQKFPEAEECYKKSITLMPLDWHAWHELAAVLRRLARLEEAENAAQIAVVGKELRKECLALPDASQAPPALLHRIFQYAVACGDEPVAAALRYRRGENQQ